MGKARTTSVRIVGVGESVYARWGRAAGKSELALACDAIVAALADAGVPACDVDGLASYSTDTSQPALVQAALGIGALRHTSLVWGGGGGGCMGALANAVAAIEAGQARVVVVYRALAQGLSGRLGAGQARGPLANFTQPFGLVTPAQNTAMIARRFMHERGAGEEHLAEIALTARAHAQGNPRAVMNGKPLLRDDYFRARLVAEPLRVLDCCLECDAGAAVVVAAADRARDAKARPVRILAVGQDGGPGWGLAFAGGHNQPLDEYVEANARSLAVSLFANAGLTPGDVKVAQIYDAFTSMVLVALESYGFAARGEGAALVQSGALRMGGRLPFNTSGGGLSEAYVQGLNLLVEAVRQMRGEARLQVESADVAFVGGGPGIAPTSAALLARE